MLDLVNNDTFTPVVGDICRSSGQPLGVVLANAGTDSPNQVPIGVWAQIASPGYVGKVATGKDGLLEVNCLEEPDIGAPIYLSATAGKGTKVYFTNGKFIGNALSKRYDGNWKATLEFQPEFVSGTLTPGQIELLGTGTKAVIASTLKTYANLADNQTLTLLENVVGVPTLITFEVQKTGGFTPTGGSVVVIDITAATDSATAWAAIVAFLNARPNAAYTFTASASGFTFVAKQAGSAWNSLATGTAVNTSGINAITTTGLDPRASAPNALRWLDGVSRGVVPPFVAGAASIAPGTDGASGFVIDSYVTLSAPSALTLASTGTPVVGNKLILCMALSLGNTLSIVNGPLANTIASFPAALTRPRGAVVNWDGFNFSLVGYLEGEI